MHERVAYVASHAIVRVLVLTNMALLGLSLFPALSRSLANGILGGAIVRLWLHSLWFLPTYVVVEALWMRKARPERVPLLIDAGLAATWIVLLVVVVWPHIGAFI